MYMRDVLKFDIKAVSEELACVLCVVKNCQNWLTFDFTKCHNVLCDKKF